MIKRVGEKEIFKTKFFSIKDIELKYSKGKTVYQIIEKADSTLIIPLTKDLYVIFIKEFFYAINEYGLTVPKGRIEFGHDEFKTANKELQEEIGYKANTLEKLAVVTISPGYLTQKTHIILATNLQESKLQGDEIEPPITLKYPLANFEKLIEDKQLQEARVIAALYLTRKKLQI